MRHRRLLVLIVLCAAGVYGQSLGDVARQQKQKQQVKTGKAAPKVITNEDIPSHPDDSADSAPSKNDPDETVSEATISKRSAEQWKSQIRQLKSSIASFQAQLEKLKSSIHFVEANAYTNGVEYNQRQIRKQQEADRAQRQLDAAKAKLANMQEAARQQGFGSAVYDPE